MTTWQVITMIEQPTQGDIIAGLTFQLSSRFVMQARKRKSVSDQTKVRLAVLLSKRINKVQRAALWDGFGYACNGVTVAGMTAIAGKRVVKNR